MSTGVVIFDNGYRLYTKTNVIADKDDNIIADLYTVKDLSLNLEELSDKQMWALCKPIIQAYEKGINKVRKEMANKLLSLFNLEELK